MGDLLIRNVPEQVKRAIERAAQRDGRSLSATAIELLEKSLTADPGEQVRPLSAWSELRSLLDEATEEEAEEFARIMEEIESNRKHDFGRPLPEFDE